MKGGGGGGGARAPSAPPPGSAAAAQQRKCERIKTAVPTARILREGTDGYLQPGPQTCD